MIKISSSVSSYEVREVLTSGDTLRDDAIQENVGGGTAVSAACVMPCCIRDPWQGSSEVCGGTGTAHVSVIK